MKKNGFTFIEILGVITLLALMSIIVLIVVDDSLKKSKETLSQAQIENIKSAASMWRTDHIELIPNNDYYLLSLGELIDGGYIDNVIDPNSKTNYNNSLLINVGINNINIDDVLIRKGYTKLEYIESTGTQYINTGVIANQDTSIDVDGYVSRPISLYGTQDIINGTGFTGNTIYMRFRYMGNQVYDSNIVISERHRFKQQKNLLYIDDNLINTFNQVTTTASYPIYLFGRTKATDGSLDDYGSGRIYSAKIWDGNNMIRNYIPCYRNRDKVPGLYDLVEGKFYTNANSNNIAFEYSKNFDDKYGRLKYIEASAGQYTKTLVVPNANTTIEVDGYMTSNRSLYGTASGLNGTGSGDKMSFIHMGNRFNSNIATGQRHVFRQQNNLLYVDGVLEYTFGSPTFIPKNQMFLFARSTASSFDLEDGGSGRIYGVKIWDGDKLIRDMRPYIRKSDNVAGLYDFVNDVFYTNYGSGGSFTYEVYENPYDRLYTKLEYIESTGTQYIDTGYVPNNNTGIEADFQFNSTTSQSRVFGVGTNSGKANFVSYEFYINGSGNFAYTFKDGNGDWVPTNIPADTSRHTLRFNVGNKNLVIDNNNTYSIGNISNVSSYPIYIMAENYDGTDLKWVDETRIKLYSFKIYNGYYLIRNFVPAIRNSDNAVGLYDEVYDVFYTNSGTGEFIKGEL